MWCRSVVKKPLLYTFLQCIVDKPPLRPSYSISIYIYIYTHVYIYIYMHVCICIYIYIFQGVWTFMKKQLFSGFHCQGIMASYTHSSHHLPRAWIGWNDQQVQGKRPGKHRRFANLFLMMFRDLQPKKCGLCSRTIGIIHLQWGWPHCFTMFHQNMAFHFLTYGKSPCYRDKSTN